jgi:hypothetical protein
MKYEFHPLELTTKVNLKCMKNNDYQFIDSHKYIEYQKIFCHPYKNLEYEPLKQKFHSTSNQKLRNCLTLKTKSQICNYSLYFSK